MQYNLVEIINYNRYCIHNMIIILQAFFKKKIIVIDNYKNRDLLKEII